MHFEVGGGAGERAVDDGFAELVDAFFAEGDLWRSVIGFFGGRVRRGCVADLEAVLSCFAGVAGLKMALLVNFC